MVEKVEEGGSADLVRLVVVVKSDVDIAAAVIRLSCDGTLVVVTRHV